MTRINLIPPSELYDQHLIAEYREIRLLNANMRRTFASKNPWQPKIPPRFTLNKGHVNFFIDKGMYIHKRYMDLQDEMRTRGFVPTHETIDTSVWPAQCFNDWTPSQDDMNIVRERIALRVSQRPGWYRYCGKYI